MSKYREKAAALAAQMNLEEKVGQTLYTAPAVERLGIVSYNWWNEALHGVARAGTATVFPQAIGMAATFDEELLKQVAITSPTCFNSSSSNGAAMPSACGNTVAVPALATPCSASFHQL